MTDDKYEGIRCDSIGFGAIRLMQRPEDFCYGIDAVLLADFASKSGARKKPLQLQGKKAMDLGCGTGIIPLILSHKTELSEIWGMELQEENVKLAIQNIKLNSLEKKIHVIQGDVSSLGKDYGLEMKQSFDMVCSNPPYMAGKTGIPNERPAKLKARHETSGTLEDFIRGAAFLLKPRGDFYMVHRPSRLVDILSLCRKYKLEPKGLRFVAPRQGDAANILLLQCTKNGNPELKIMDPLWVYNQQDYTEAIEIIYERKEKFVNFK